MTTSTQVSYGHHEVNVVFARGTSLDALTGGLRDLAREPFDQGEGNGWTWAVHDMPNADIEDYDPIGYRRLRPDGTDLVVIVSRAAPKASRPTSSTTATAVWSSTSASRTWAGAWATTRTTSPPSSWPRTS